MKSRREGVSITRVSGWDKESSLIHPLTRMVLT